MLFESRIMHPIIRVLTHPNTDINIQCIEFMHDLICEEISEDEAFTFMFRMIVAMVDNGLLEGLLDSLHKLDEEKSVE